MDYLVDLIERYPTLDVCKRQITESFLTLSECFASGNTLYVCGNGGSCADAQHIVGELMKGFKLPRRCSEAFSEKLTEIDGERGALLARKLQGGLRAVALDSHQSLQTAYLNDVDESGLLTYAQQLYGYGRKGDALLAISTSGNAKNVLFAAVVARALDMKVLALTGWDGGELARIADIAIKAPQTETYRIQELHLPIYHCLCLMLEEKFFGEKH